MLAAQDQYQQKWKKKVAAYHINHFPLRFLLSGSFSSIMLTLGQIAPPKTPARSKTPLRTAKKLTPESNSGDTLTTPARKQKNAASGVGGGEAEFQKDGKPVAVPETAKVACEVSSKGAVKVDKAEATEGAVPQVKTVPPSPKVYIRKVKGKAKKSW